MENKESGPKLPQKIDQTKHVVNEAEEEFKKDPNARSNFNAFVSGNMTSSEYTETLLTEPQSRRLEKILAHKLNNKNDKSPNETTEDTNSNNEIR